MKIIELKKKREFKIFIISLFLISSFPNYMIFESEHKNEVNLFFNELNYDKSQSQKINEWQEKILKLDQNKNSISDQFELKFYSLDKSPNIFDASNYKTTLSVNEQEVETNSCNQINFVIQFPYNYDYSTALKIFENNRGEIKYTYKYAINGFSGSIDYLSFENFYKELKEKNIHFFIEEDSYGKTQLYYNSRNLRLRPYVWNNYNYTGDNQSSIAILDTGIDEEHAFFDNSTTGKVVAWANFIAGSNTTAFDDNGHGTHVAGIAAGLGTTNDFEGRAVATNAQNLDFNNTDIEDGGGIILLLSNFDIPSLGEIEIECSFIDETPSPDYTLADFYLLRSAGEEGTFYIYDQIGSSVQGDWQDNMTYNINSNGDLGNYFLASIVTFKDGGTDDNCTDSNSTIRIEVHWPFNPPDYGSGNYWKGVAPEARLVSVKIFDEHGGGSYLTALSDTIQGIEWCIEKRKVYNITVMSMSFGFYSGESMLIDSVNNAVEYGIVAVASAGNAGGGGNKIVSPADADKVITVAANNFNDQITEYSSQGGSSYSEDTTKPDITAPGGSFNYLQMFSADTNDNDAEGALNDNYKDDLWGAQGTSMSCPVVAGAANLLIQAMGGGNNWDWDSGLKSRLVKAILLMTATETYPLQREYDTEYSPSLNRGEKDVHEGYGRLNIDAAIEAWINNLTSTSGTTVSINQTLYASRDNPIAKHAYAGYVEMKKDIKYTFILSVPGDEDYDLYLYNSTPDEYGQPELLASGISSLVGQDETFNYTTNYTGKYFLVAKAIGLPYPDEDDNDGKNEEEVISLLEFLMSPLGLLIIGSIAAVVIIMVLTFRAMRRSKVDERERIKSIVNRPYS